MNRINQVKNTHGIDRNGIIFQIPKWMVISLLVMIVFLSTSESAFTQSNATQFGENEEILKQQLRVIGMSEEEIQSQIDLLKLTGRIPESANIQPIPDSLRTRITKGVVEDVIEKPEQIFDELAQDEPLPEVPVEPIEASTLPDIVVEEAPAESKTLNVVEELHPFGYEIFNLAPTTFEPLEGGPVDPSYPLGPGDEVALTLWGDTEQFHRLRIDREGKILIPDIGQVVITGMTLEQAEKKIRSRLSGVYSGLKAGIRSSSTFFDLSLGKLRSIRVFVLGEVVRPGGYTMRATVTAFNALYFAGGPNSRGSLREVQVIRNGKVVSTVDLYSYLLYGKTKEDVRLHDGDALFVPIRGRMVAIKGEINAPALYELKPWDGLQNLLTLARGLKPTAYINRIQVDRIVPFDERDEYPEDRRLIDVDFKPLMASKDNDFKLVEGDVISVFPIIDEKKNMVFIEGAVLRPGTYEWNEEMRLTDLIEEADGVLGEIYLDRVDIIRTRPDLTKEIVQVNLEKALEGDEIHDLLLDKLDEIKIYSIHEIEGPQTISIQGHVKNPGNYPLHRNMTLYDLLFKAGGMLDPEFIKSTYLNRADIVRVGDSSLETDIITFNLGKLLEGDQRENRLLRNQDEVIIYSMDFIEDKPSVIVSGHVKRPGRYRFSRNMTLYDLLFKSGGMLDEDFRLETYLERADLIRLNEDGITRRTIPVHLGKILLKDPKENMQMKDKDELIVYDIFTIERKKYITIAGRVKNPGDFELTQDMTLKDLVIRAGGYTDDAFKFKAEVARIDPWNVDENNLSTIIDVELPKLLSEDSDKSTQFKLKEFDRIIIRKHPFWQLQRTVKITGEVKFPGEYSLRNSEENLTDIVERAGGLTSEAFLDGAVFTRRGIRVVLDLDKVLESNSEKEDISLQPGDSLSIPKHPMIVQLSGAFQIPGFIKYIPGKKSKFYINRAGGYIRDADKDKTFILHANGRVESINKRFWFDPKIDEGDDIRVALKEKGEPFDISEFLKETASIVASFATTIFIISQTSK